MSKEEGTQESPGSSTPPETNGTETAQTSETKATSKTTPGESLLAGEGTEGEAKSGETKEGASLLEEGTEGKAAAGPDFTAEVSAEDFSSALPEGFQVADAQRDKFLEIVNGATNRADLVKGLLEFQASLESSAADETAAAWETQMTAWKDEVKNDPEVGGAKMAESLALAKTVIKDFAADPSAMMQLLTQSGLGNNVHVVKFLARIGKETSKEATPVNGNEAKGGKTLAEKLFTSTT